MFGGLTKTSSRIAIAAALGLTLGGFAFKATPAQAADLGGDCCADLEERVAELEATTVRKGNKKVSVTLSGWVVKSMNFWDDGDDRSLRRRRQGLRPWHPLCHHRLAHDRAWLVGRLQHHRQRLGDVFGFAVQSVQRSWAYTDRRPIGSVYGSIATLYSYIYIKSDTLGHPELGSSEPGVGQPGGSCRHFRHRHRVRTAVWFEGAGFFLRPKGAWQTYRPLSGLTWGDFLLCQGLGAGIGVDCWGVAQPAVRYDSPTWGGFRFETSYGKNQAVGADRWLSPNHHDPISGMSRCSTRLTGTASSCRPLRPIPGSRLAFSRVDGNRPVPGWR